MTLHHKSLYSLLSACLLCTSCADTEQYIAREHVHDPAPMPSYQEVFQQWMDSLSLFDYEDPVEPIPTDADDPDYDNFVETQDFKVGRTVSITWNEADVTIDNPQESRGVKVTAEGGRVVVCNLETAADADDARGKVTYLLQGTSADGQIKIYSDKKFQLRLQELNLTCTDGPAISIQHKKRCFIMLQGKSTLIDGEQYASDALAEPVEDEKGCLFSEGQLIFCGEGTLSVWGRHQHAIASDEYIRIHPGCYIQVNGAKDGIHCKQQYRQTGGNVFSYAQKDALQSDSLGIRVEGGYLYLFGERAMTANGGGSIDVIEPGRVCPIEWLSSVTQ